MSKLSTRGSGKQHKHGHACHRIGAYGSWLAMNRRCTDPNHKAYHRYGGRGVTICERWQGPDGFANFLTDMGERPVGLTLDRFPNPDGNYEPGNCRWATPQEQNLQQKRLVTQPVCSLASWRAIKVDGDIGNL